MKEEKKYPFIMIEIWTDQDKRSETYQEKYVTVSSEDLIVTTS